MTVPCCLEWKGAKISRLVLGTVQLGMPYGIANTTGQPKKEEAHEIVATAWRLGVNTFDTAQAYGGSEAILGSVLGALGVREDALVITKLSPDLDPLDTDEIRRAVDESCRRLGTERIWCLMVHREEWLESWRRGLGRTLRGLRASGRVDHLGVSVCSVVAAREALENPDVDIVEAPCNAWDQRMLTDGVLDFAKRCGKLCFVRSIYLQGLLTMPLKAVCERLPLALEAAEKWHTLVDCLDLTPREVAVSFGLSLGWPLVVGAETAGQIEETARLARLGELATAKATEIREEMRAFVTERIVNPSLWESPESLRSGSGVTDLGREVV